MFDTFEHHPSGDEGSVMQLKAAEQAEIRRASPLCVLIDLIGDIDMEGKLTETAGFFSIN